MVFIPLLFFLCKCYVSHGYGIFLYCVLFLMLPCLLVPLHLCKVFTHAEKCNRHLVTFAVDLRFVAISLGLNGQLSSFWATLKTILGAKL
jgi:hypothetical protein